MSDEIIGNSNTHNRLSGGMSIMYNERTQALITDWSQVRFQSQRRIDITWINDKIRVSVDLVS